MFLLHKICMLCCLFHYVSIHLHFLFILHFFRGKYRLVCFIYHHHLTFSLCLFRSPGLSFSLSSWIPTFLAFILPLNDIQISFFFLVLVFYYTYRFLSLLCQQFHPYFFCLASKDFILCVSSTTPSIGCISSLVPAVSSLFPRGLHEIDSLVRLGSVWCLTQRYNLLVISRKGLVWWWQTCCLWLMNYVCYLGLF